MDIDSIKRETETSLGRNKLILVLLFVFYMAVLSLFVVFAPSIPEEQRVALTRIPHSSSDFVDLVSVVKTYCSSSYLYLISAFSFLFIFLQSFGIPGPLILCIISGALFGRWTALVLVTLCSTVGSITCYVISESLGKGLIVRQFPEHVVSVNSKIEQYKDNLFYYMLFLRLTPIIPNWLLNLCSPIIGVDKLPFVMATLIGLIPANFFYISSGLTLSSNKDVGLDLYSVGALVMLGGLALLPTVLAKKYKNH